MNILITAYDQECLYAIRKNLVMLERKESIFLKVELLFYEVLTMAKTCRENIQLNSLLAALRNVQANTYEKNKRDLPNTVPKRATHSSVYRAF